MTKAEYIGALGKRIEKVVGIPGNYGRIGRRIILNDSAPGYVFKGPKGDEEFKPIPDPVAVFHFKERLEYDQKKDRSYRQKPKKVYFITLIVAKTEDWDLSEKIADQIERVTMVKDDLPEVLFSHFPQYADDLQRMQNDLVLAEIRHNTII